MCLSTHTTHSHAHITTTWSESNVLPLGILHFSWDEHNNITIPILSSTACHYTVCAILKICTIYKIYSFCAICIYCYSTCTEHIIASRRQERCVIKNPQRIELLRLTTTAGRGDNVTSQWDLWRRRCHSPADVIMR